MSIENVRTIQQIYEAFGQGDVPAILERTTADTSWGFNGAVAEVPWHAPVEGQAQLPAFFGAMAGSVDFEAFEPREFMHCGPHVIVDVRIAYTVRGTGRRVDESQLQWWTLDAAHKVCRLMHYEDTAQVREAVSPVS